MKIAAVLILMLAFAKAHADVKCTDLTEDQFTVIKGNPEPEFLEAVAVSCKDESEKYRAIEETKNRECNALPQTQEGNATLVICKLEVVDLQRRSLVAIQRAVILLSTAIQRSGK